MAETTEVAELLIQLRADVGELRASLDESKEAIAKFSDGVTETMHKATEAFLELFAIEKVREFFKHAVEASAEMELSMAKLEKVIIASGQNWQKLKGRAEEYALQLSKTTKFQKEDVVDALTKVTFKTQDFGKAMGIVRLATKLAAVSGDDLATSSNVLTLAMEGNQRGIMSMARSLAVTGTRAKDVSYLFSELEKRTAGASTTSQTYIFLQNQLNKAWKELSEEIGNDLLPTAKKLIQITTDAVNEARELYRWWKEFFGIVDEHTKDITKITAALEASQAKLKQFEETRARILIGYKNQTGILKEGTLQEVVYLDKQIAAEKKHIEELDKLTKHRKEKSEETAKFEVKVYGEGAYDVVDQNRKAFEEAKKTLESYKEYAKMIGKVVYAAFEESAGKMFAKLKEGTLDAKEAFESLGRAIFKSIVKALAGILQEMGAKELVEAAASLYYEDYKGAFEHGAAGATLEAGAGAASAAADAYLAEGGLVTKPTKTMMGEGGKAEGVIPLSNDSAVSKIGAAIARLMPGGAGGNQFHFYGYTPGPNARTDALAFAYSFDQQQARKGNRGRQQRSL